MPGVYIRGDETLSEDVLRRLKEESSRAEVWLEVYVFSNRSLVNHIAERARGLGVGLTIYYIDAADPGPWQGREKAIEMMSSWVNEYVKRYGKDAYFGIGFILDMPIVTLTIFNATEEQADKVATRVREIVPCRYPVVYFTDKLFLLRTASIGEATAAAPQGRGENATAAPTSDVNDANMNVISGIYIWPIALLAISATLIILLLHKRTKIKSGVVMRSLFVSLLLALFALAAPPVLVFPDDFNITAAGNYLIIEPKYPEGIWLVMGGLEGAVESYMGVVFNYTDPRLSYWLKGVVDDLFPDALSTGVFSHKPPVAYAVVKKRPSELKPVNATIVVVVVPWADRRPENATKYLDTVLKRLYNTRWGNETRKITDKINLALFRQLCEERREHVERIIEKSDKPQRIKCGGDLDINDTETRRELVLLLSLLEWSAASIGAVSEKGDWGVPTVSVGFAKSVCRGMNKTELAEAVAKIAEEAGGYPFILEVGCGVGPFRFLAKIIGYSPLYSDLPRDPEEWLASVGAAYLDEAHGVGAVEGGTWSPAAAASLASTAALAAMGVLAAKARRRRQSP
ncbi:hypothetical protein ODS41_10420 [Pyrobaculum sp. 3827-6]|uniref:hypothetical protein n=1 Tax=Pyrobaculum sp. 3827-6 TaxID=2983604 RepID=UPI0021D83F6C|nr:hypothetical protein [Pyrobaculum sp. 3827-6]MCU7788323.1 hypothetical protein [Pyrobaculum sp. 3827-6]